VEKDVDANPVHRLERNQLTGGDELVPVVDWRGETVRGFAESRFRALAKKEKEAEAERERERAAARTDERATDGEGTAAAEPPSGRQPA